jgi:hypothetical protein
MAMGAHPVEHFTTFGTIDIVLAILGATFWAFWHF